MHTWQTRKRVIYSDGTSLPYIHDYMNMAMDYVINDMLIESKIGKVPMGPDGKPFICHDRNLGTHADSVVDVYRKLFKAKPPTIVGFDKLLAPGASQGKDPYQATQDHNAQEWQTQIAAAHNIQKATSQGKMPSALDRFFKEILNPQVDWRDQIQTLFARKVGTGSFDWKKPDKRLIVRDIYAPGRSGFGAGTIVVAGDTSGSIDYGPGPNGNPSTGDVFLSEIAGILEDLRPKRLVLLWCDAHVHRVDECEEPSDLNVIRSEGVGGGGGTSFIPVFEWIEKEGIVPDALVYLTDGQGSFPGKEPVYPVIWGSIIKESKYPFGDVVDIPKQAA
jgi:predicted metal-dependent peptidase